MTTLLTKLNAPSRITQGATKTRLTLWPAQHGSLAEIIEYGSDLVCVRYRYDSKKKRRFKTVELIVDEKAWQPPKKKKGTV